MSAVLDLARIAPGFGDPVRESQAVFRELMESTARPGRLARFAQAPAAPAPLNRAAGAVARPMATRSPSPRKPAP